MLKHCVRLALIAGVFTTLYAVVSHLMVSSVDGESVNLARSFLTEFRRSEALEVRGIEIAQSMQVKKAIVEDLIADRLSLREAEERFLDSDSMVEADQNGLVPRYRSPESEQDLCRQVVAWTTSLLDEKGTPQEAKRVRRRLMRQIEEQFPHQKLLY